MGRTLGSALAAAAWEEPSELERSSLPRAAPSSPAFLAGRQARGPRPVGALRSWLSPRVFFPARKTKKQVFVSYNLQNTDSHFAFLVENRIKEEMAAFPEKF